MPSSTRGGPTQARVSVEREPSTGATVDPAARPRRRTAPPRSAARAGAGHRRAPTRPGREPRPAPSTVDRRRRPGHGHPDAGVARSARARPRSPRAAPRRVRCRPAGWRASRPAGPADRPGVRRGAPGRCGRGPGRWSAHRPCSTARGHAGTNLTRVPGASRAGSLRSGSQRVRSVWPSSRQPPGDSDG